MEKQKVAIIIGTRPEIIKCSPLIRYLQNQDNIEWFLIHTNQHYSENMDKIFFDELELSFPKYNLWIWSWSHGDMTWKMLISIEKILLEECPHIVFVQWDTNTVLAWWLSASKLGIKVAHIEAWLRSYDKSMPEEINRILTDHLSDYLFSPTQKQADILISEWIEKNKIFITGNTIVDAIYEWLEIAEKQEEKILKKYWLWKNDYILLTAHRPSNVDQKDTLKSILEGIWSISDILDKKIFFPVHPRTKLNIEKFWLGYLCEERFILSEPIWFVENLIVEKNSYLIATDSWWIQEEACILKKKTLILRDNTERPETLEVWWAVLVWNNKEKIINWFFSFDKKVVDWYNPFWNGETTNKILSAIEIN